MLSQSIVTELQKVEKENRVTKSMVVITTEIIKDVVEQEVLNVATAEIR